MSLKVWEAYRIVEGHDHWAVLMDIKKRARHHVKLKLLKVLEALQKGFNEEAQDEDHVKKQDGLIRAWNAVLPKRQREVGHQFSLTDVNDYLKAQYRDQLSSHEKNPFHFDMSLSVRRYEGRWLIIPYGGRYNLIGGCLDFLKEMLELEDYHYQNQSDAPDPEPGNWEERSRVWNDICDNAWQDFIVVDIVSYEAWFDVTPAWDRAFTKVKLAMAEGMSAEDAVNKHL